tara:strand:+ start:7487 stop:8452 length:966 start_codon:yes stop_codon:yes gene_type:complete
MERKMIDKDWLGADLIFDLDGDHLPGVSDADFPSMISLIQEQAWSLWNDFLEPEFNMKKEFAQFTFSGHRGFHIHVRDPTLMGLDSNARREIVSYIRGQGLEVNAILSGDRSGWRDRIEFGKQSVLEKLRAIGEKSDNSKQFLDEFHGLLNTNVNHNGGRGVSKNRIITLAESVLSKERIERLSSDHNLAVFGKETGTFWDLVKLDKSVVLGTAGETDENVTVDVKRVIRHLGSLHGKCGLRVTEVPYDRLDPDGYNPFNPLLETVAFTGLEKTQIKLLRDDVTASLEGTEVSGSTGEIVNVSEAMSIFLCLKGWGERVSP